MESKPGLSILCHDLHAPPAFTPDGLIAAVRESRHLAPAPVPPICVLDFDGDLTDWLIRERLAEPFAPWACFHTTMYLLETEGVRCGIVARTIGGPYAVLIAEQLHVSGAGLTLGLTSAGRVSPSLPLPSYVIPTSAVRDEGASFHYLPPADRVVAPTPLNDMLAEEIGPLGIPVAQGCVWTTDAPYRETKSQLDRHAAGGVLAVEMQTASLFAFAAARNAGVGMVAHVTNAAGHSDEQFDKGADEDGLALLKAMLRAGQRFLSPA
ncbi:MAG: nucleoside phosphorylase [Acidobacteria bacterium]|nr:nucleoside phosphorylase [Acidobacteriota bacterium]